MTDPKNWPDPTWVRARSSTGRAFMSSLAGLDFDDELLAEQLAEAWHAVACSKWKVYPDHLENELILFRIVVQRLRAAA